MYLKKTLICFIIFSSVITLQSATIDKKPRILFIHYPTHHIAGIGVYLINCSRLLKERNYEISFLVIKNSPFQKELEKNQLPFDTIPLSYYNSTQTLTASIYKACAEHRINVICCNWYDHSLIAAQTVARKRSLKVIFIDHMNVVATADQETKDQLSGLDGILGVNPSTATMLAANHLTTPYATSIPPFFDEDNFLNFTVPTHYSSLKKLPARTLFFREAFGIGLKKLPTICMIANMYEDRSKNHRLILQAIHHLVHRKNKPIEVMLAGDGIMRPHLEEYARLLKIDTYIHFLGFTDRIPELLYFTDFHVLSSRHEAFGIVHMEAACIGKASLGATDTGATAIIKDGVTGLLFENDNVNDLVEKIEFLIDHPGLCHEMGKSAYAHALLNFSNNAKIQAFENFLQQVLER